ncbi:MAG: aldo/keto reductase [Pseudomonadales bacterium]|nr:aldo/keto reductase [Pseudomonadales bacterium]MDG1441844.1 aldo/keto reductase [Pseudomonadales bacterium]
MQYRQLGRSALKVSELCLGTMNFGPRTSEAESFEILHHATTAGINFVDTANQYGGDLGVGTTETILGKWFAQDKSRRDQIVLATKVHEPMSDNINDRGLSARHIQMACDASLKRLGVDHIDLYQMHHIDRSAPIEEIWQAMDRLITQGKITYVGSSNFPGWAIARANEKAIASNKLGLVSEQGLYNLIERRAEMEVLPACREYGLGLIPWSPLAGGLLSGKQTSETGGRRDSQGIKNAISERQQQLNDFQSLCEELSEAPSAIALAWLLHQPGVSATIIGPGSVAQLSSVLHVPDIQLNDATLARIDEIFPAVGESPEAYAW